MLNLQIKMERFKQLCKESDFESLFCDVESCPLRPMIPTAGNSSIQSKIIKRHIDVLKEI